MPLPLNQLSQGLSHSERDVRDAVAVLFSKSMCNDQPAPR